MTIKYRGIRIIFGFLLLITSKADPFSSDNPQNTEKSLVVIGIASISCLSMVVILCLGIRNFFSKLCPDNSFKDLENEDAFFNDIAISTVPASFPMYPPVVNTVVTTGYNAEQVYFEPLPDISHRHKSRSITDWSNLGQVRPKIARLRSDRKDSVGEEDYLFDAETRKTIEKIFSSNRRTFPRSQLQYIKELGTGWFGKVLQGEAHDIQPGKKKTKVMVMMLKEGASNMDKSFFLQEAFAYREIENVNVLKMFYQCVETTPLLTILEFCQNGNLKTFMVNHKGQVEQLTQQGTQLNMLCDIAAGLQCLHQHNYVHRDLAIRNCLVTSDLGIKIGDYGLAEQLFKEDYYHDHDGVPIPIRWLAPESLYVSDVVRVNNITTEANIWTFGVVMWELLRCGDVPYSDLNDLHVIRLVAKERIVKLSKPNVNVDNIGHLCEVMEMCWRYEPSERPTIRELRIMLLHLLSNKHQADLDFFEEKWNQLKPKKVASSESHESFADLRRPESKNENPQEHVQVHSQPRKQNSQSQNHNDAKSFPILAPLGNELSLAEELGMTEGMKPEQPDISKHLRKKTDSPEEDVKSDASQFTSTEDGFEIVSVGSRKRADDSISTDKDRFSFIHSEEFAEGDSVEVESSPKLMDGNSHSHPDQSKSPARPNFVDLTGPGGSSFLSVTPSDKSDSRNLMDEFSPMAPLSDSSLLKMDKYTNYLCTAVTSIENDDSILEESRTKNSSEVSLHDSIGSLK